MTTFKLRGYLRDQCKSFEKRLNKVVLGYLKMSSRQERSLVTLRWVRSSRSTPCRADSTCTRSMKRTQAVVVRDKGEGQGWQVRTDHVMTVTASYSIQLALFQYWRMNEDK
jgi:hypothetical protein